MDGAGHKNVAVIYDGVFGLKKQKMPNSQRKHVVGAGGKF